MIFGRPWWEIARDKQIKERAREANPVTYHYAWLPKQINDGRWIWLQTYKATYITKRFSKIELCEGSYE